jgi:GGDEF domain-containing protein
VLASGEQCPLGMTIGFALAPADGDDAATLLKRADAAMYRGKQAGGSGLLRWPGADHEPD